MCRAVWSLSKSPRTRLPGTTWTATRGRRPLYSANLRYNAGLFFSTYYTALPPKVLPKALGGNAADLIISPDESNRTKSVIPFRPLFCSRTLQFCRNNQSQNMGQWGQLYVLIPCYAAVSCLAHWRSAFQGGSRPLYSGFAQGVFQDFDRCSGAREGWL